KTTDRMENLDIGEMGTDDGLMDHQAPRITVSQESENRRRRIEDNHRSVRPASTALTTSSAVIAVLGRSARMVALSARRAIVASSRVAKAETDIPSRAASRSSRSATSSGTFRK